jgi:hypothetical protein
MADTSCDIEVFMAVKTPVEVFWIVRSCSVAVVYQSSGGHCCSEDGGSKLLRNVGILSHHYTASQHKRPGLGLYMYVYPFSETPYFWLDFSVLKLYICLFI